MADKKKNVFERIGAKFRSVVSELKKVVWPSKEKLKSIAAVVFVVILFFAIYLTAITEGGHYLLEKAGFYDLVEVTTVAESETEAETEAVAEVEGAAIEAVESDVTETESTSEAE